MKIMIRALMIISLVSSVISCRVYDKLLDVAEESLDKKEVSMESHDNSRTDVVTDIQDSNGITSMQESGRSGRRARSLGDDSQSEQEEGVVDIANSSGYEAEQVVLGTSEEDKAVIESSRDKSGQVVVDEGTNKLSNEANGIKSKANAQLVEIDKMSEDLKKTKSKLDTMKIRIGKVDSVLKEAIRTPNKSYDKKLLLFNLHKAMYKAMNNRNYADLTLYRDLKSALEISKGSFNYAKKNLEFVLGDLSSSVVYTYMHQAQQAISNANNMFKSAKKSKIDLNVQMKRLEEEFIELERYMKLI